MRLLCHSCNFVRPTTWLEDSEVSLPHTMPLSGLLSVRPLCCSCLLLVFSSGYLSPPLSITSFLSLLCSFALFSSVFLSHFLSVRLFFFIQSDEPLFPLLIVQWNTRSQPDGSSHKFQAVCHKFWLQKRKRMHAWPTRQPLPPALGPVAAGKKKILLQGSRTLKK